MEQYLLQIGDTLHAMTEYHHQQHVSYEMQLEQERTRYRALDATHQDALNTIQKLHEQLHKLKQENKDFMSVSRIVALSNENTKLYQTIELLEKTIKNINIEQQQQQQQQHCQTPHKVALPEPAEDVLAAEPVTHDDGGEPDTVVYSKKKIKGTYYLVSSEDEIYELNEETETPGQLVGRYITKNDKRVIRWQPS
jgi:CRISPR/Cas system-associated endonuclease/helicase Cas3